MAGVQPENPPETYVSGGSDGGEGGIRTHVPFAEQTDFESNILCGS